MDINLIKGVGDKSIELLSKMNLLTVNDLIMYYPYRYNVIRVVSLDDAIEADKIFSVLMGDNVEPRREFIQQNAQNVTNLDI